MCYCTGDVQLGVSTAKLPVHIATPPAMFIFLFTISMIIISSFFSSEKFQKHVFQSGVRVCVYTCVCVFSVV